MRNVFASLERGQAFQPLRLESQYHAVLPMLRDVVERCPPAVWSSTRHTNAFWQVAYLAMLELAARTVYREIVDPTEGVVGRGVHRLPAHRLEPGYPAGRDRSATPALHARRGRASLRVATKLEERRIDGVLAFVTVYA